MKKILMLILAVCFFSVGVGPVFAASDRCVVKETKGKTVVLECRKNGGNFEVEDRVKIKTSRSKQIEGC